MPIQETLSVAGLVMAFCDIAWLTHGNALQANKSQVRRKHPALHALAASPGRDKQPELDSNFFRYRAGSLHAVHQQLPVGVIVKVLCAHHRVSCMVSCLTAAALFI